MRIYDKQLKSFEIAELENISFGRLEGEKDDKLGDSFFITSSIKKLFSNKYNYILSPKGGGKSAVFRTLSEKMVSSEKVFNYDKHSIISINTAFGYDDNYLSLDLFKDEENRRNYTLSWGLFLLSKLINDIKVNHKEKNSYDDFIRKIKKIDGFKDKFQLHDLGDYLKQVSFGLSFTVGGQPIDIKPKIGFEKRSEDLIINEIFQFVNDFYKENNISALIIIDRLDNFVKKESYTIQKNYIQGLIDCIEEISNFNNICSVVFIRTDLFYAFDIDFEYDKIKERTQDLLWENGETVSFIVYRLLANPYVKENFYEYFDHILTQGQAGEHSNKSKKNILQKFLTLFEKQKKEIEIKRTIDYTTAENFLRLFFPDSLENFEKKQFCLWIFEYLEDAHGFVNPRLLIYFFNEVINAQIVFNSKVKVSVDKEKKAKQIGDYFCFDIFSQEIFPEVYKKVQNDELRSIYKILKEKDYQNIFKEINKRTAVNKIFNYGDINIKRMNIEKEEYERLIKYLMLLGYFKKIENQKFEIPNLYHCEMTLQALD